MRNSTLQVAIATVLGVGGLVAASTASASPTVANCAAFEAATATEKLFIAGSSAAQTGLLAQIAANVFGGIGNPLILNGTNSSANSVTNFKAICGTTVSGATAYGFGSGVNAIIYYRAEGGSVAGALPIAAGSNPPANTTATGVTKKLQFLSVSGANTSGLCAAVVAATATTPATATCNIAGTSSANGTNDSFGPTGLQNAFVDLGVTDVEPGLLGTVNYPTAYTTSVYGKVSASQLGGLSTVPAFSQAFGFFVNTSGFGATAPTLDLSSDTVRAIFNGTYTDWSAVPTTSGKPASTVGQAIKIVNRENGSGSKASTQAYLYNYGCVGGPASGANVTTAPLTDGWATKEVLVTVGANPGAITYASIDNAGSVANTTLANLDGLVPTNLLASTDSYHFWVESFFVPNNAAATANQDSHGTATNVINAISTNGAFVNQAGAPHNAQIGIIPGSGTTNGGTGGNVVGTADTGANGKTIYINAFTRGGSTCAAPTPLG